MSDYSIFRHVKYHQDEFSLACPLGKRHVFQSGAKDMHRSWLRTMTEGGLGAIRSKLIQRKCFNLAYELYSIGIGKFGLHYKWSDSSSLVSLFES